jgi:hypothetical protein
LLRRDLRWLFELHANVCGRISVLHFRLKSGDSTLADLVRWPPQPHRSPTRRIDPKIPPQAWTLASGCRCIAPSPAGCFLRSALISSPRKRVYVVTARVQSKPVCGKQLVRFLFERWQDDGRQSATIHAFIFAQSARDFPEVSLRSLEEDDQVLAFGGLKACRTRRSRSASGAGTRSDALRAVLTL